jgi:hypothetical protein
MRAGKDHPQRKLKEGKAAEKEVRENAKKP